VRSNNHELDHATPTPDLGDVAQIKLVFAIKREGKITSYFFELENKRKSFKEMLDKYKRYKDYFGTQKCKDEWKDFKTFTVVTQIRPRRSGRIS